MRMLINTKKLESRTKKTSNPVSALLKLMYRVGGRELYVIPGVERRLRKVSAQSVP